MNAERTNPGKRGVMIPLATIVISLFLIVFSITMMILISIGVANISYSVKAEAEEPSVTDVSLSTVLEQETGYPEDGNVVQNLLSLYNNTHDSVIGSEVQGMINILFTGERFNLTISGSSFHDGIGGDHSVTSFGKVAIPGESYVDQENATNAFGGTDYMQFEYDKPIGADGAKWTVRHGDLDEYTIDIPAACWNAYADKVSLRIVSRLDRSGGTAYSRPQCYQGTGWNDIGKEVDLAGGTDCPKIIGKSETYDASWYSFAVKDVAGTEWHWCDADDPMEADGIGAAIYEEKILWHTYAGKERVQMRYYR